jgi:hypothetical protein
MITERVTCLVRSALIRSDDQPARRFPPVHGGLRVVPNIMIIGRQLSGP